MRNNLATLSFVISIVTVPVFNMASSSESVGLISVATVLAVISVILGIVAIKQIKKNGQKGKGWAVAGIVIGACGIMIAISIFQVILNNR